MSDPKASSNPLIRQSAQVPSTAPLPPASAPAVAPPAPPPPPPATSSTTPRRKVLPERRPFSWSRPFRFVLRPKVLFLGIIPAGLVLSLFDPLGLYTRVENGLDVPERRGRGPTPGQGAGAGGSRATIKDVGQLYLCSAAFLSSRHGLDARCGSYTRLLYRSFSTLSKPVKVLALESSADDSCAAIVDSNRKIWSNIVIKQHETNAKWGGIHPREAQLAHQANMPKAISRAFSESGLGIDDIDVVAFTRGPGMPGCLHVCGNAARAIGAVNGKPILGIHHMQAHTLTPLLTEEHPPSFPFLTLLVSGGHTQIVLAEAWDKFQILADALDSRVGNAVDRIARYIQLPQSPDKGQGAMLEHYASLPPLPPYDTTPLEPLPVPMGKGSQGQRTLAFSFSGLTSHTERLVDGVSSSSGTSTAKTASQAPSHNSALLASGSGNAHDLVTEDHFRPRIAKTTLDETTQREISRTFQNAITAHLAQKVELCFELYSDKLRDVRGMVMSGGVASNKYLRTKIQSVLDDLPGRQTPVKLYFPPVQLCTDNAAMIAWAAICRLEAGHTGDSYELLTRPKWSLEDLNDGR